MKRLQRAGRLTEVAADHFFLPETVARMAALAVDLADGPEGLTTAGFRDRLENGRKVAIQVLEFFDRAGLTARAGEARRVRRDRLEMFGAPVLTADRNAVIRARPPRVWPASRSHLARSPPARLADPQRPEAHSTRSCPAHSTRHAQRRPGIHVCPLPINTRTTSVIALLAK